MNLWKLKEFKWTDAHFCKAWKSCTRSLLHTKKSFSFKLLGEINKISKYFKQISDFAIKGNFLTQIKINFKKLLISAAFRQYIKLMLNVIFTIFK